MKLMKKAMALLLVALMTMTLFVGCAKDKKEETLDPTEVVMVVDVPAGVEVAAVYYDNNTGRWVYVPVVVDPITKTVKLTVPGSCTLQLVKK